MSPRTLIATLAARDLRPLAFQGVRVMDRWPQLTALLKERLGERHAALFAEPMAHGRRDAVDWYAHAQGAVLAWADARDKERGQVQEELADLARDLESLAARLRASNDPNQAMAAQILDLAMQYPGPESLYLVGNRPVLVNWGSIPAGADAQGQSVLRFARVRASAATRTEPGAEPAPDEVEVLAGPEQAGFPWLAFLLWFVAGCCLALLLILTMQVMRPEPEGNPLLAAEQDFVAERRHEAALRAQLDQLRAMHAAAVADCMASGDSASPSRDMGEADLLHLARGARPGDDLGLVDGCWRTQEYARAPGGETGAAVYCMDATGMGFMQWTSSAGACQGLARARYADDGSLRLAHGEITCSDGAVLAADALSCEARDGAAACRRGDQGPEFSLRRVEQSD